MTTQISSFSEYKKVYAESVKSPEKFWNKQAKTFTWSKKWKKTLDWNFKGPDVKWFEGGKLNITVNCLDRHLKKRGHQVALIWEPNEPSQVFRSYTYQELYEAVCQCANALHCATRYRALFSS